MVRCKFRATRENTNLKSDSHFCVASREPGQSDCHLLCPANRPPEETLGGLWGAKALEMPPMPCMSMYILTHIYGSGMPLDLFFQTLISC